MYGMKITCAALAVLSRASGFVVNPTGALRTQVGHGTAVRCKLDLSSSFLLLSSSAQLAVLAAPLMAGNST